MSLFSKENLKFLSTIRFKLTFFYFTIFLIFSVFFISLFNIYLRAQIPDVPGGKSEGRVLVIIPRRQYLLELDELERMRDIREKEFEEARKYSLISLLPITALSFFLGYYVSGKFLEPINSLSKELDHIEAEKLGTQLIKHNDDEIGRLIESFNRMSTRLQQSFELQVQFVQDASHEIKTPLAIIRTNLDTALASPNPDHKRLVEAINESLVGIEELNRLTDKLLELTQPFNKEQNSELINISELVNSVFENIKGYSQSLGVNLALEMRETDTDPEVNQLQIEGSKLLLSRALYNLVENAIKYSSNIKDSERKPEVKILIESGVKSVGTATVKSIQVKVIDNGQGIPKEFQDKIFERFYRIDRSRNKKYGGFGLGLAISKKIIEEHGGSLSLSSKPGQTEFTVSFLI